MHGFSGQSHSQPFLHICHEHSRVIPAESYSAQIHPGERLRCISLLQQKASSLEAEIAERQRAECALREEKTKLTMALTAANLGVWELDLLTNVLTCSDQCKAHFGLAAHQPLSYEDWLRFVYPDERNAVNHALRTASVGGTDYTAEYRVMDAAGRIRWISAMGRSFHNGCHRMLGVTLDVTDQRRSSEILEQTVGARTAELQETIAELEAFSYSISHDMRAPLRSMQGFANILIDEFAQKIGPEGRAYLMRIISSAERMDRLIQDVLTFSRVARTELKLEPVNLDHLLRGILECYPNMQPPKADVVIEGNLPCVLGNAAALTQCQVRDSGHTAESSCLGASHRWRRSFHLQPARLRAGQRHRHSKRSPRTRFRHIPAAQQKL